MTKQRRERQRAPNGTRRYREVVVLLEPDLLEALDACAQAHALRGRSAVVRRACREYVRRHARRDATRAGSRGIGQVARVQDCCP